MIDFPQAEDKLFRDDLPDWTSHAWIDIYRGKFSPYADGYIEGAKALINDCESDRRLNDILIYPIVFLFRQYIELRLKEMIIGLRFCSNEEKDLTKTHKIDLLWFEMKGQYKSVGEKIGGKHFQNAERLILEFCKVDPLATGFRYPVDTNGNPSLQLGQINIKNFGGVMDRLANFLDSISDHVAALVDMAGEMYQEYRSNIDW